MLSSQSQPMISVAQGADWLQQPELRRGKVWPYREFKAVGFVLYS